MIATLTRALLVLQIVVAVFIAAAIEHYTDNIADGVAGALGIASVLAARALITANNFRIAARFPCEPASPPLGWRGWLSLYFVELRATLVSSSWAMPFRPLGPSVHVNGAGVPVLLIHGYGCNSGYWHPLSRRLDEAGISFHAVDLEPVLCSIDDYAAQVTRAMDSLCEATGQTRVIIVAHSMGGLVARAWLREHGCGRVARLVTLGTPHDGTALARFGPGENSRQMCRTGHGGHACSSPWLTALNTASVSVPTVSIYSCHDNIIAPQSSSHLPGSTNIVFAGIGHVALGSHPAVMACVVREVQQATRAIQDTGNHQAA